MIKRTFMQLRERAELRIAVMIIDRRVRRAVNKHAALKNITGQLVGICYRRDVINTSKLARAVRSHDMRFMMKQLTPSEKIKLDGQCPKSYYHLALTISKRTSPNGNPSMNVARLIERHLLSERWEYLKKNLNIKDIL